jgi:hypothetical protein
MDNKTIFTKTAKGVGEAVGKTRVLSRDLRAVLKEIDGKASLEELLGKISTLSEAEFHQALNKLSTGDYIREFVSATLESNTLDFPTISPLIEKTERPPGQRTRINESLRMQLEARAKAEAEAHERAQRQQEERARRAEEEYARRQEEEKARRAAQQKAMIAAQESARRESEERARQQIEEEARRQAEQQARRDAEEAARREAEEQAEKELEERTRQEAEQRARQAAEEKSRLEAQAKAKREAEEKIRREAEEQARKNAEIEARRLAEEQARREMEEARRKAEQQALREAEEQARQEAEAQAKKELEEQRRHAAEMQARQAEEERVTREAEARAKKELEEQARREAEERSRQEAEEKALSEAEKLASKNAEEIIQREFEELARQQAEETARQKKEQARRDIEELARRRAEAREKKEAEERARRELEELAARREAEVRAKQEVENWMREAAAEKVGGGGKGKPESEPEKRHEPDIDEPAEQDEEEQIEQEFRKSKKADEEELIEPAAEKPSLFKRRRQTYRKPIKWRKPVALGLFLSMLLALGLLHVIGFDSKTALFEKTATAQFQQPVRIGKVHLSLLPQPHWRLEGVSVGSDGHMTVPQVKATMELSSLFSDTVAIKSIELESPVFSERALEWLLFGRSQQRSLTVGRVNASNARLASKNISLPPFNAAAEVGADGSWTRITVDSLDRKTRVLLRPDGEAVQVELTADLFKAPFGSAPALDGFIAKGTARRNELVLTDFSARVYDGVIAGTARLQWGASWSLGGDVHAKVIDAAQLAPELLQSGKLEGSASYALEANHADRLFAMPRMEGRFTVQNGTLLGVDFAKLLRSANSGGKSSFAELSGAFVQEGGKTQLQKLVLNAGMLSVRGNADMDASKNLNGRLAVELKSPSQQLRGNLVLAGTLGEPQFNR